MTCFLFSLSEFSLLRCVGFLTRQRSLLKWAWWKQWKHCNGKKGENEAIITINSNSDQKSPFPIPSSSKLATQALVLISRWSFSSHWTEMGDSGWDTSAFEDGSSRTPFLCCVSSPSLIVSFSLFPLFHRILALAILWDDCISHSICRPSHFSAPTSPSLPTTLPLPSPFPLFLSLPWTSINCQVRWASSMSRRWRRL